MFKIILSVLYLPAVYLVWAFVSADINWMENLWEWEAFERFALFIVTLVGVLLTLIMGALLED